MVRQSAYIDARFAHAGILFCALQRDGRAAQTTGVPAQLQPTAQKARNGNGNLAHGDMLQHAAGAAAAMDSCHLPMALAHCLLAPAVGHTHLLMHAHTAPAHTHTHARTHAHTHTHTHTHTNTHTHTHTHAQL